MWWASPFVSLALYSHTINSTDDLCYHVEHVFWPGLYLQHPKCITLKGEPCYSNYAILLEKLHQLLWYICIIKSHTDELATRTYVKSDKNIQYEVNLTKANQMQSTNFTTEALREKHKSAWALGHMTKTWQVKMVKAGTQIPNFHPLLQLQFNFTNCFKKKRSLSPWAICWFLSTKTFSKCHKLDLSFWSRNERTSPLFTTK